MNNIRIRTLLASTTGMALALGMAVPATAADQAAQSVIGLEEIVVTARRVEEDLQRVPIAISVVTAEQIEQRGAKTMAEVVINMPGFFSYTRATPRPGGPNSSRGLLGTITYFAGTPSSSSSGTAALMDVQNIQALKGPQGTLFGLASNAGALVIEPAKPVDRFAGKFTVSAGTYNRKTIAGMLNTPLLDGKVLVRLAAETFARDGWVTNISNGDDIGRFHWWNVRPSVTFRPTDDIESYTLFQYSKIKTLGETANVNFYNFSPFSQLSAIVSTHAAINGGTREAFDALRAQVLATQYALGPYKVMGTWVGCPTNGPNGGPTPVPVTPVTDLNRPDISCMGEWVEDYRIVNHTEWSFMEDFSVKNIFSSNWGSTFSNPYPQDNVKLIIHMTGDPRNTTPSKSSTTWSDELQFFGKFFDRVDLVAGVFTNQTYNHPKIIFNHSSATPHIANASISKTSSGNWSVYGQGNIDLSDMIEGLTATAGYRYSWDRVKQQNWGINPTTLAITGVTGGPTSNSGHATFSQGSYTLGLQYQLSPQTMLFITNAKGYSSGGLQNVAGFEKILPDSLNNIEVGVKSTFGIGDVTVRANASAYYGFYDNVKITTATVAINPLTGQATGTFLTANAAEARIHGFEADLTAVFPFGLELGANVGMPRFKFTNYPSFDRITLAPIDLSDSPTGFTPKIKTTERATYHLPLDEAWGDISFTGSFTYQSKFFTVSRPFTPTDRTNPNTGSLCWVDRTVANGFPAIAADGKRAWNDCSPPQYTVDVSIDWDDVLGHDGLSAALVITNVAQQKYGNSVGVDGPGLGFNTLIIREPRMFYLRLGYEF